MAERKYKILDEIAPADGIPAYLTSAAGIINIWNESVQRLLGYSKDEMLGHNEKSLFFDPLEDINRGGSRFSWRKHKDGHLLFVQESSAGIIDGDSQICYLKTLDDYTRYLSLHDKCELWLEYYELKNEPVMIVNSKKLVFEDLTEKMASEYGCKKEEIINHLLSEFEKKDGAVLWTEVSNLIVEEGEEAFYLGHLHHRTQTPPKELGPVTSLRVDLPLS